MTTARARRRHEDTDGVNTCVDVDGTCTNTSGSEITEERERKAHGTSSLLNRNGFLCSLLVLLFLALALLLPMEGARYRHRIATSPPPILHCFAWEDEDSDGWWQAHPQWEPSDQYTNDTHTCFRQIQDPSRADFLQKVYHQQFPPNPQIDCQLQIDMPIPAAAADHGDHNYTNSRPQMVIQTTQNVGFAAVMVKDYLDSFVAAYYENKILRPILPYKTFHWHYIPQTNATAGSTSTSSWANCPTKDQECYFLPITNCPRPERRRTIHGSKKKSLQLMEYIGRPSFYRNQAKTNPQLADQRVWLSDYLLRPRHVTRYQVYRMLQEPKPKHMLHTLQHSSYACSWIHVRRGDVMTEKSYARQFYSIQHYLTKGKIRKGETIMLLTDDEAAVEEATVLHPDYQWIYWNRSRHRGAVAFNSHFPSHNPAWELLVLLVERKLASLCRKGVFGKSNMATMLRYAMHLNQGGAEKLELIAIDDGGEELHSGDFNASVFMQHLEAQLAQARHRAKEKNTFPSS